MKAQDKIKLQIIELVDKINQWNVEYFDNNHPTVSDRVYDTHLKMLVELEKQHPEYIFENSPTQNIGEKTKSEKFVKVKHQKAMLSLNKAYSMEEVQKFENDIKKTVRDQEFSFFVEPKIDGLSISLFYVNGELNRAVTRGDGVFGEDVTKNVKDIIMDIPTKINYLQDLELRGEIYISKENFKIINEREENKYANSRNLASGTLKQLDSNVVKQRNLSSFFYELVDPEKHNIHSQEQAFNFIKHLKFSTFDDFICSSNLKDVFDFIKGFELTKDGLEFDVDGIVIKLNEVKFYNQIGFTSKFPKYNIAFKFDDEITQTTLEDIFITIGRTGVATYNAKLKPVLLKGTIVSAATLHNYNYIEELNLSIGDEVFIKKAGEIIPKVVGVSKKNSNEKFQKISHCPSCKQLLANSKTFLNQICLNENCQEKQIRKIIHFSSRQACDIEGLGEGIVRKFFDFGILEKIEDIYELHKHKDFVVNQTGFGKKFWSNLDSGIKKSFNVEIHKLIFALGIPQLGTRNASAIAREIKQFDNLITFDLDHLDSIRDIGPITIKEMKKYFANKANIKTIEKLIEYGINPKFVEQNQIIENSFFANKSFVITGTFAKSRNEIKQEIERLGGIVVGSISKNTFALLCGEKSGSKLQKAQELGIKIIDENELNKILLKN